MKKIIFCDIDGTLAKRMHRISNKNIRSIKAYSDAGGEFILTTGRSIVSTQKFQNQISETLQKEPNFIICSNGGYVIDNINKKIEVRNIKEEVCRKILTLIKENKLWAMFYTEEANDKSGVYATEAWFSGILKMLKALNCLKIRRNTNLKSFKIIIASFSKKKITAFKNTLDAEFGTGITSTVTVPRAIEVTASGISKASAANHVLSILGLKKDDAAAFGDSGNDIQLLKNVDLPIAINSKNALLIKSAKHVIPKFKNGVSKAIDKYIM